MKNHFILKVTVPTHILMYIVMTLRSQRLTYYLQILYSITVEFKITKFQVISRTIFTIPKQFK